MKRNPPPNTSFSTLAQVAGPPDSLVALPLAASSTIVPTIVETDEPAGAEGGAVRARTRRREHQHDRDDRDRADRDGDRQRKDVADCLTHAGQPWHGRLRAVVIPNG